MKNIFQSKLKKLKRKKPGRGWAKAFKRMLKNGDDKLLIPDVFEDEIFDEIKLLESYKTFQKLPEKEATIKGFIAAIKSLINGCRAEAVTPQRSGAFVRWREE